MSIVRERERKDSERIYIKEVTLLKLAQHNGSYSRQANYDRYDQLIKIHGKAIVNINHQSNQLKNDLITIYLHYQHHKKAIKITSNMTIGLLKKNYLNYIKSFLLNKK